MNNLIQQYWLQEIQRYDDEDHASPRDTHKTIRCLHHFALNSMLIIVNKSAFTSGSEFYSGFSGAVVNVREG